MEVRNTNSLINSEAKKFRTSGMEHGSAGFKYHREIWRSRLGDNLLIEQYLHSKRSRIICNLEHEPINDPLGRYFTSGLLHIFSRQHSWPYIQETRGVRNLINQTIPRVLYNVSMIYINTRRGSHRVIISHKFITLSRRSPNSVVILHHISRAMYPTVAVDPDPQIGQVVFWGVE